MIKLKKRAAMLIVLCSALACAQNTRRGENTSPQDRPHKSFEERSVKEAAALTPNEAKAILVAQAAGLDFPHAGFSGAGLLAEHRRAFDVYTVTGGWYVCCRESNKRVGVYAFVGSDWTVGPLKLGSPTDAIMKSAPTTRNNTRD